MPLSGVVRNAGFSQLPCSQSLSSLYALQYGESDSGAPWNDNEVTCEARSEASARSVSGGERSDLPAARLRRLKKEQENCCSVRARPSLANGGSMAKTCPELSDYLCEGDD